MPDIGINGEIGHGTRVTFNGITYRLIDLNGFEEACASIDVTHTGSPDAHEEYKPGLINPGECEFDMLGDPDHEPVKRTRLPLVVTFPLPPGKTVPASWSVAAFVIGTPITIPVKDRMMFKVKFKLSGKVTKTLSS